jgi:heme A synthase
VQQESSANLIDETRRSSLMNLLGLIVVLLIVGFALWCINNLIPMEPTIKRILNVVVILVVLLWLLVSVFHLGNLGNIRF